MPNPEGLIFNLGGAGAGGYKLVTPPTVSVGTYTYDGTAQGPSITYAADTQDKIITTGATGTAAGTYTLTFTLKATNKYVWSDGTTAPKTYTYTIAKQSLSAPAVSNTSKTYNGSAQGPTIANYDNTKISVANSGNNVTSATDAGTYYVVFSLVDSDNYEWASGATTSVQWTIAKASCGLSISPSSVTLSGSSNTATVSVTRTGGGSISASPSDSTLVTASVSGTTVTLAGNNKSGSATVTITVAETSNYLGGTATVSVTCDYLKIVQWTDSTATGDEIGAMIDAAQAGSISLYDCGWRVGDVRTITVSAFTGGGSTSHAQQSIDIVISSFSDYEGCGCVLQFDFKDELATAQRWHSGYDNTYKTSEMKTTTLPALVNALPSWLKDRLKEFSVKVASNGNGSIETVTGNKLALRSEVEIFGSCTYSKSGEGSQIPYYQTSANRVKKRGHSGSANAWWERSPLSGNTDGACRVYSDGSAYNYYVTNANGLAPFGCL